MAQLSDDCFAFGGPMMSVDEAVAIIAARVTPVQDVETVALGRCRRARFSPATFPRRCRCRLSPIPRSTVMPCAAAIFRTGEEQAFPVTGRVQAGAAANDAIKPGHAVRIFTGAPMPDGADTVFMQEDVRLDGDGRVVLPAGLRPGANVRPAGEDIPAGHCALTGGPAPAAAGCRAGGRVRPDRARGAPANPRRGVFDRQRIGIAGKRRAAPRNCSIPTASC